jgi:hypothetical protein
MRKVSSTNRNTAVLDALFPTIRQGVLATTLTSPEKWWYLSELAHRLGTSPSSLQRELPALAKVGILEERSDKCKTYFRAKRGSPLYAELRGLFEKSTDALQQKLNTRNPVPRNPKKVTLVKVEKAPTIDKGRVTVKPQTRIVSATIMSHYDREELYARVWSQSMLKIARDYGVSDVRIAKVCRKLFIPMPGRGYWNKKSAGKQVPEQPSLPDVEISRR